MKKALVLLFLLAFIIPNFAQATLTTIGTATYMGSDYNLIWDDDNNGNSVVWLDYSCVTPYLETNWVDHVDWASGLNDDGILTYYIDSAYIVDWETNSWRLPSAGTNPEIDSYETTSEMGHLYYEELGLDWGTKTSDQLYASNFDHLFASGYWYGTELANNTDRAWIFFMGDGYQGVADKNNWAAYALALRNATVTVSPVPEPGTILLLGAGLFSLAGARRKLKK